MDTSYVRCRLQSIPGAWSKFVGTVMPFSSGPGLQMYPIVALVHQTVDTEPFQDPNAADHLVTLPFYRLSSACFAIYQMKKAATRQ